MSAPVPRLVAGRYRLDEQIGAGAMGVVWRAYDERLDRAVAVKQLLLQPGLSPQDAADNRARAMREGRIAARLQHPHAISVFDVALGPDSEGGADSQPWLVMEYLPSRSLATVLSEQGPLPPREVARIGRQVADALAAAHAAGIVHRDVKPGNVLLGEDGTVKITDFGISRASWDVTVTRTGVLAGTPAYFAPEVARGEVPGPASDVFSLGSTLYTAVEGKPPFGLDENTLALLRAVADGRVRPPRQAGPLSALLMHLLREDPAERPTMARARDTLGMIAAGGSGPTATAMLPIAERTPPAAVPPWTPAPSPPPPVPTQRGRERGWQRRAGVTAAVVFGLLVLGVVAFALAAGDADPPPTAVPAPTTTTAPPPAATAPAVPAPAPSAATSTTPPPPTPSTATPTPTTPPPTPPTSAEPTEEQLEQTVRDYYALLPDQLDQAYSYLGPALQRQSGGRDGYRAFWSQFSDVRAQDVRAEGMTVGLTIVYTRPNGSTIREPYVLRMDTDENDRIVIASSQIGQLRGGGGGDGDGRGRGGDDDDDDEEDG